MRGGGEALGETVMEVFEDCSSTGRFWRDGKVGMGGARAAVMEMLAQYSGRMSACLHGDVMKSMRNAEQGVEVDDTIQSMRNVEEHQVEADDTIQGVLGECPKSRLHDCNEREQHHCCRDTGDCLRVRGGGTGVLDKRDHNHRRTDGKAAGKNDQILDTEMDIDAAGDGQIDVAGKLRVDGGKNVGVYDVAGDDVRTATVFVLHGERVYVCFLSYVYVCMRLCMYVCICGRTVVDFIFIDFFFVHGQGICVWFLSHVFMYVRMYACVCVCICIWKECD
jgi:hypothetical protein